jgi:ribosomal protein S18 acetylase RimI-like enzyme
LDLLTVDPDYQRQGAGRMLVKWGTSIADYLGLMAVVESTDQGRELYESEGFKFINKFETKLPESGKVKSGSKSFIGWSGQLQSTKPIEIYQQELQYLWQTFSNLKIGMDHAIALAMLSHQPQLFSASR